MMCKYINTNTRNQENQENQENLENLENLENPKTPKPQNPTVWNLLIRITCLIWLKFYN